MATRISTALDAPKLAAKKAELEAQLAELNATLEAEARPANEELAIALHQRLCHLDHTESCGWDYEGDDWTRGSHARFYDKANAILSETTLDAAIVVLRNI